MSAKVSDSNVYSDQSQISAKTSLRGNTFNMSIINYENVVLDYSNKACHLLH